MPSLQALAQLQYAVCSLQQHTYQWQHTIQGEQQLEKGAAATELERKAGEGKAVEGLGSGHLYQWLFLETLWTSHQQFW